MKKNMKKETITMIKTFKFFMVIGVISLCAVALTVSEAQAVSTDKHSEGGDDNPQYGCHEYHAWYLDQYGEEPYPLVHCDLLFTEIEYVPDLTDKADVTEDTQENIVPGLVFHAILTDQSGMSGRGIEDGGGNDCPYKLPQSICNDIERAGFSLNDIEALSAANGAFLVLGAGDYDELLGYLRENSFNIVAALDKAVGVSCSPNDTYALDPSDNCNYLKNATQNNEEYMRHAMRGQWERTWGHALPNESEVVAHFGTGTDLFHQDLVNHLYVNPGEIPGNGLDDDGNGFIDDVHGYDFVNNDGDPMDDHGHGTYSAGIIAAECDNAEGVGGVNDALSILSVKVADANGIAKISDIVAGMYYVINSVRQGPTNTDPINVYSWGYNPVKDPNLATALNAATSDKTVSVHVPAGNDKDGDGIGDPDDGDSSQYPNVMVGTSLDYNGNVSVFANYGRGSNGRNRMAYVGENVYTTAMGGGYAYATGTSFTNIQEAGATAYAWMSVRDEAAMRGFRVPKWLTYSQLRNVMVSHARVIDVDILNEVSGYGEGQPGLLADDGTTAGIITRFMDDVEDIQVNRIFDMRELVASAVDCVFVDPDYTCTWALSSEGQFLHFAPILDFCVSVDFYDSNLGIPKPWAAVHIPNLYIGNGHRLKGTFVINKNWFGALVPTESTLRIDLEFGKEPYIDCYPGTDNVVGERNDTDPTDPLDFGNNVLTQSIR